MRRLVWLILVIGVGFCSGAGANDGVGFVVIVNPENPVKSMTYTEVSDIFLTKNLKWPDKTAVLPVDLNSNSEIRKLFTQEIHGKSISSVESFVNQQLFSGRAKPPLVVDTEAEAADFVRKNRGAVAYVSSDLAPLTGVRVVSLLIPPRPIRRVQPEYTTAARSARVHGTVVLDVVVNAKGEVSRVSTVKGLGFGLSRSAISAVRKWKFEPASLAGQATEATVRVKMRFN